MQERPRPQPRPARPPVREAEAKLRVEGEPDDGVPCAAQGMEAQAVNEARRRKREDRRRRGGRQRARPGGERSAPVHRREPEDEDGRPSKIESNRRLGHDRLRAG